MQNWEQASNLCGCRVGVLAVGGGSDAVSLENLLGVLQHGLIAELQVELQREKNINMKEQVLFMMNFIHASGFVSDLLLQHVLPLLSHLLHQQREVRDPVSCLQLLQCSVQQTEGASPSHTRAETVNTPREVKMTVGQESTRPHDTHTLTCSEPRQVYVRASGGGSVHEPPG